MNKTIILFLIISVFTILSCNKNSNDSIIVWNENRKLTWDDFKGTPDKTVPRESGSTVAIEPKPDKENGKLVVNIRCLFNKNKSWVKKESKSSHLLKHEQGHFDLEEVYARILRRRFTGYDFRYIPDENNKVFRDIVNRLYSTTLLECMQQQKLYDNQTNHGENLAVQKQWEKKIFDELKKLENYR